MNQILAWSRQVDAKHLLFMFDSCFSGTVFKARATPSQPPYITDATLRPVRQFITAGDAGEAVPARSTFTPLFGEAFAYHVVDSEKRLKYANGDLNRDGYLTGGELGMYLKTEVPKHVRQSPQYGKINDYDLSRGDFVFVVAPQRIKRKKPPSPEQSAPPVTTAVDPLQLELAHWSAANQCGSDACLQDYLNRYPEGQFSGIARARLSSPSAPQLYPFTVKATPADAGYASSISSRPTGRV